MPVSNKFYEFQQQVIGCFQRDLPGLESQLLMAPPNRREEIGDPARKANAVRSSVLILFYEKSGEPYIVFIKRPEYNGVHSGQIAFPGGRWEQTDKSFYHTALREAREETGILPERVRLAGNLSELYIPPSNYLVSPFVGFYEAIPVFRPDPLEVAQILEIPFGFFVSPTSIENVEILAAGNRQIYTPCFKYQGHIIWGATAMMLNELLILWKSTGKN